MVTEPCCVLHVEVGDDRATGPARLQDQALLAAATPLLS